MIPQAIYPVNWLPQAVTMARAAVPWLWPPASIPLTRPSLSELAQPGAELPRFVAECAVARKYLDLLGPLDWPHFPERDPPPSRGINLHVRLGNHHKFDPQFVQGVQARPIDIGPVNH